MGAFLYILIILLDFLALVVILGFPMFRKNRKQAVVFFSVIAAVFLVLAVFDIFIAAAFSALVVGFTFVFEVIRRGFKIKSKVYTDVLSFGLAVALSVSYFAYSVYVASNLEVTKYDFDVGSELKIVQISDIHYGKYGTEAKLKEIVDVANAQNPDLVVLSGDIFDEYTDYGKMVQGCKVLGELNAKYGVFYVFGNHDGTIKMLGDYTRNSDKMEEMVTALNNNNITVLRDQAMLLGNDFVLVGRLDRSFTSRKTIDEILFDSNIFNANRKVIVIDHQPSDYDSVVKSNANICLNISGHTHGGQMFPINVLYRFSARHSDDLIYGTITIDGVNFVVSSGATGGEMPVKNCTVSEIVVIELH